MRHFSTNRPAVPPGPTAVDRDTPPAAGSVEDFRFPEYRHTTLANGATVLAARADRGPLVEFGIVFPAGAQHEAPGEAGTATFLAGMLDEGTADLSALDIAAQVERLGGRLKSGADWDAGSLHLQVLSAHQRPALQLLVHLATASTLPPEELERQRQRRLAELLRKETDPSYMATRRFNRAVFGDTAYGHTLLGSQETVETLDRARLTRYYDRCYAPAGAILLAVGDLDPDALVQEAEELFGDRPGGSPPASVELAPPSLEGRRLEIVDRPSAAQTELRLGHVGVPRNHPDYVALSVLNAILGGKFTSRINLNLREKNGYTYGAQTAFIGRRGPGPFVVRTAVATPVAVPATREVLRELERIVAEPVTEDELRDTQSYMVGTFPYSLQTLSGVISRLETLALYGLPEDYFDTLPDKVRAVTRDDVLRVAREHIHPQDLAIVAVGPRQELEPAFADL